MPQRRSPTSTATRASSSTAATRSSSSASTPPTSRSPTCSSTASCRPRTQLDDWVHEITIHTYVHENIKEFLERLPLRRAPDGDAARLRRRALDLLPGREGDRRRGRAPHGGGPADREGARRSPRSPTGTTSACRTSIRTTTCSYPGNFLSMLYKMTEVKYEPDPRLERALDVLWILHADHEQNCSTSAVRAVGSSEVDPYSAVRRRRRPRSTARCTAAPTRPCCRCSTGSRRSRTSPTSSRA